MDRDPSQRYQNVAELATALLPFGSRKARASVESIVGTLQSAGLASFNSEIPPLTATPSAAPNAVPNALPTAGAWAKTDEPRKQGVKGSLLVGAAVGLLVVAALGVGITRWLTSDDVTPAAGLQGGSPSMASIEPEATSPFPDPPVEPVGSATLDTDALPVVEETPDAGAPTKQPRATPAKPAASAQPASTRTAPSGTRTTEPPKPASTTTPTLGLPTFGERR